MGDSQSIRDPGYCLQMMRPDPGLQLQSRSSQCSSLHQLGQETARLIRQLAQHKNSAAPKIDYAFELWSPIGPVLFLLLRIKSERTSSRCTAKDCPSAKDFLSVLRSRTNDPRYSRIPWPSADMSSSAVLIVPCPDLEVSGRYGPTSETLLGM